MVLSAVYKCVNAIMLWHCGLLEYQVAFCKVKTACVKFKLHLLCTYSKHQLALAL